MAQIAVEMTSDEAKLWRGLQRINDQLRKTEEGYKKTGRASRRATSEANKAGQAMQRAGRAGEGAFGDRAAGQISRYVAGVAGVTAIMGTAARMMADLSAERERAAESIRESEGGLSSLAQLATTPQQFAGLVGAAKQTFAAGGTESLDAAGRMIFSLASAGAMGERELFTDLGRTKLIESPDIMARSARTLQASMGKGETGGFRGILSKAFAASEFSPVSAEALLEGASRAGGGARALGISDEEVLAAAAITATATGSAELGGTQLRSLMFSLPEASAKAAKLPGGSFDLKGKNLMGMLHEVQGRGYDDVTLGDLLGRKEAVEAYRTLLREPDQYGKALGAVHKGEASDQVGTQLRLAETLPTLATSQMRRQEEAKAELSREDVGVAENIVRSMDALDEQRWRREGASGAVRWLGKTVSRVRTAIAGPEIEIASRLHRYPKDFQQRARRALLARTGEVREPGDAPVVDLSGSANVGRDFFQAMDRAAGKLDRAADKLGGGTTLAKPDQDR